LQDFHLQEGGFKLEFNCDMILCRNSSPSRFPAPFAGKRASKNSARLPADSFGTRGYADEYGNAPSPFIDPAFFASPKPPKLYLAAAAATVWRSQDSQPANPDDPGRQRHSYWDSERRR